MYFDDDRIRSICIRLLGDLHSIFYIDINSDLSILKNEIRQLFNKFLSEFIVRIHNNDKYVSYLEYDSIIYMVTQCIKLLKNEEDLHTLEHLSVDAMKNPSHFIQTSAIKLISQLYINGHSNICQNIINRLMNDVRFCVNNKLALLELTESLVHCSAKDILINTHIAIRNVWGGLKDNNSMISQRAREVLGQIISKNMESVLIFDILESGKESHEVEKLMLGRLNGHILFLLERSNKTAIINSIRIISNLIKDNEIYINWIIDSLNCLNSKNSLFIDSNNPFRIITEENRVQFSDSIYSSVIDVLINISKREQFQRIFDKVNWINYFTEYFYERLKSNISFNVFVFGKYLILLETLLTKKNNEYYELYNSILDIICNSLHNSNISNTNKSRALNILGIIFDKSENYLFLIERFSNEIVSLTESESWELKESALQLIKSFAHINTGKFESIIFENDLYLLPYMLLQDQESYVRASALECLAAILKFSSVLNKYTYNTSIFSSLLSNVLLKVDEDSNVRINNIKLISMFMKNDSIVTYMIDKGYLDEEVIQKIKSYSRDDDWEVRIEYLQMCYDILINTMNFEEFHKNLIYDKFEFDKELLNATEDPIRLVRKNAYKLLKDIMNNLQYKKLDYQLSQFLSELSSIDFDLKISMQSANEVYDPDDDIYPLEPSYIENMMDCPF